MATAAEGGRRKPYIAPRSHLGDMAKRLRAEGASEAEILSALERENRETLGGRLDDSEVRRIASTPAATKPKGKTGTPRRAPSGSKRNTSEKSPPTPPAEPEPAAPDPKPSAEQNREHGDQAPKSGPVAITDFYAHMPDHRYIFEPTRDLWPPVSVDARLPWPTDGGKPIRPSRWLDQNAPVEQMVWAPGQPTLLRGRLLDSGGWIDRAGVTAFNLYRAPIVQPGDATDVGPWVAHIRSIYGEAADHIIKWFAQRVQDPQNKINHALVLGGRQGIGKDTIIEPVKHAIGAWNFQEVTPPALLGRFNSFVKSVILRISEARDLGEMDCFAFYEHTKTYTAAPPDVLRCDEKNIREHAVLNVCGVIITTNHKSNGIFLPADDRRHFVAWSDVDKEEFGDEYWNRIWRWYEAGGIANVAAYLAQLDISDFDPKAPPPKTDAFWHIVQAARGHEENELADVLDAMGNPPAVTREMLIQHADVKFPKLADWLAEDKNRRRIPHKLEARGYEPIRNPDDKRDGQWRIEGKRRTVYADRNLSPRDRLEAAQELTR